MPTDRQFTGQRAETGLGSLYDFQARMYSPVLGRFLSADTIVPNPSNPQSLNRFAYVRNNPLKLIDPSGHKECEKASELGTCESATNEERDYSRICAEMPSFCEPNTEAVVEFGKDVASLNDGVDTALTLEKCAQGKCDGIDYLGLGLPLIPGRWLRKAGDALGWLAKKLSGKADDVVDVIRRTIDDVPSFGRPGKQPNVRVMVGESEDAMRLADDLAVNYKSVKPLDGGGYIYDMGNGTYITYYYETSRTGVPTVAINDPALGYWTVKFYSSEDMIP